MKEIELYLHIPFCARKCGYCDFLSFPCGKERQERYFKALGGEVSAFPSEGYKVSSIFFGGGTPSLPPSSDIIRILEKIRRHFFVEKDAEISIEANPGTVTREKLADWYSAGISRISFGCQSADNEELKKLGRIHTWEQFLESFDLARKAGFDNINVDLMSALPAQTEESWERTLRKTAALGPEHLSAYSLILEEGTPFYEQEDSLGLPDEETEREMYERTEEILSEYGFYQYEISNYAREGFECRHNTGYWTGTAYAGFGLGAASYLKNVRSRNTEDMDIYLTQMEKDPADLSVIRREEEVLTKEDLQAEFMILGLRLIRGIGEKEFEKRFQCEIDSVYGGTIRHYQELGLLERKNGRIALTRKGLSLSNTVMADFLPDKNS